MSAFEKEIAKGALFTVSVEVTDVAAEKVSSPLWEAVIEQVPGLLKLKLLPDNEQTEVSFDVKVSGNQTLLFPEIHIGHDPYVCGPLEVREKEIVCDRLEKVIFVIAELISVWTPSVALLATTSQSPSPVRDKAPHVSSVQLGDEIKE